MKRELELFREYVKIKRANDKLTKEVTNNPVFSVSAFSQSLNSFDRDLENIYRELIGNEFESLKLTYNKIEESI